MITITYKIFCWLVFLIYPLITAMIWSKKWIKNTGSRRKSRGSTQNKQKAEDREGVKGDSITIRSCMSCDKIPREMRTNIYLGPIGNWQNTKVKKPPKSNSLRLLIGIWVRTIYGSRYTPNLLHHKRPTPILVTIYDNWNSGADYITCLWIVSGTSWNFWAVYFLSLHVPFFTTSWYMMSFRGNCCTMVQCMQILRRERFE